MKNDAVHAFRRGVVFHMGVAVEMDLGVLSLPREQLIFLADSILLHIECEDAAAFPASSQSSAVVAAPAGCCVDAERAPALLCGEEKSCTTDNVFMGVTSRWVDIYIIGKTAAASRPVPTGWGRGG